MSCCPFPLRLRSSLASPGSHDYAAKHRNDTAQDTNNNITVTHHIYLSLSLSLLSLSLSIYIYI